MAVKLTPEQQSQSAQRRKRKKAEDWQSFCAKNHRVYGTLPKQEYKRLQKLSRQNGRNVWQQIYSQSLAYEKAQFLPSKTLEQQIEILYAALRRIGNNINQIAHHTNYFRRLSKEKDLTEQIKNVETLFFEFVKKPWTIAKTTIPKNPKK